MTLRIIKRTRSCLIMRYSAAWLWLAEAVPAAAGWLNLRFFLDINVPHSIMTGRLNATNFKC